ncbi:MAG TPA: hypothetical protein VKG25_23785 [Bryobacteraceae bacterium]|nr:hypothetical protein [Bryobacteraceae bacterium]
MGSGALQITISLFAILGAAGLALVCDYLRHRNEELKAAMLAMRNGNPVVSSSASKLAEEQSKKKAPQSSQSEVSPISNSVSDQTDLAGQNSETLAQAEPAEASPVHPVPTQSRRPRRRRPMEPEGAELMRTAARRDTEAERVGFIERAMSVAAEMASRAEETVSSDKPKVLDNAVAAEEILVMQQTSSDGAMKDWLSRRAAKTTSWKADALPGADQREASRPAAVVASAVTVPATAPVTAPAVAAAVVIGPELAPPVVARPVAAAPIVAAPALTPAAIIAPVVSGPAVAAPTVAAAVVTAPELVPPVVARPAAAAPIVAAPALTRAAIVAPEVARPAVAAPTAAAAVVTAPELASPVVARPVAAAPIVAAPALTPAAIITPEVAAVAAAKLVVTAPIVAAATAVAARAVAAPVVTAPVVAAPGVTKPVAELASKTPGHAGIHLDQEIWSSTLQEEPKLVLVNRNESAAGKVPQASRLSSDVVGPAVQDGTLLSRMLAGHQPYTGLVICISVKDMDEKVINNKVTSFLTELARPSDLLCRPSKDEFVLLCPDERGSDSRRRLGSISQQLWDYQLRNLSNFSVQFSWGSETAWRARLSDALEAARDNMATTRRTREARRKAV